VIVTNRTRVICVALVFLAVSCSGGSRPELDESVVSTDPTPEPTVVDESLDETVSPAAEESAEPTATAEPSDGEAPEPDTGVDAPDSTPTAAPDVAPADPADYPLQGTVNVTLADGRSYEATVGCNYQIAGDAWEFRFGGQSTEGVQIEGAYDTTQPDFVILFVAGPDSLNGDDVLLSNLNGGDDLRETNDSGNEWNANIDLASPEGQVVNAQVTATCG
jgi:hypothetical protein